MPRNVLSKLLADGIPAVIGTQQARAVNAVVRGIFEFEREGFCGELAERILSF